VISGFVKTEREVRRDFVVHTNPEYGEEARKVSGSAVMKSFGLY
jgi:hypothetical protein